MQLRWGYVDRKTLPRVVQLINKTNQFNLTSRRYTEAQIESFLQDDGKMLLYFRLIDKFGDNGIVAVVIATLLTSTDVLIDTWLMSCRVLGRTVEKATLNVLCNEASRRGAGRLIGEYRATKRNGLVRDHYESLGFTSQQGALDDSIRSYLIIEGFEPCSTHVETMSELQHA
jgi:FkbH-like protein